MPRLPWILVVVAACGGVPDDRGLTAWMRVSPGEFVPGPMPAPRATLGAPIVDLSTNTFAPGEIEKPLTGSLDPQATAAAIGLSTDSGYWIVPAGLPNVTAPKYPTFTVSLSFSERVPIGAYDLVVQAVDENNRFGPTDTEPLAAVRAGAEAGDLVISLRWDTEADLDLHVVAPSGVEIYSGKITDAPPPPPGVVGGTTTSKDGGFLDFDSNANCVIDGRRNENVIWRFPPPSGSYIVRVDAFSLCSATFANWVVEARLEGTLVGRTEGIALASDSEMPHGLGAGVEALAFDVP